jgi:hypothetical protein
VTCPLSAPMSFSSERDDLTCHAYTLEGRAMLGGVYFLTLGDISSKTMSRNPRFIENSSRSSSLKMVLVNYPNAIHIELTCGFSKENRHEIASLCSSNIIGLPKEPS